MRSSSVKTLVTVVSLTFTLVIGAPSAEARPSEPQRVTQAARKQPGLTDRVQRLMRQLLHRVLGISATHMPGDPIPEDRPGASTSGIMPGDPIPVSEP
jgi:hypothetical protein